MLEEKTALPGSEPGITAKAGAEPVKDETGKVAGTPPGEEKLPFDQHPKWKSARQAEKALQNLMAENDCETVDELLDLVSTGKAFLEHGVPIEELSQLKEKAKIKDQWEAYWRDQEELKRRGGETPEETIKRQDWELKTREKTQKEREFEKQKAEDAQKTSEAYDHEIGRIIQAADSVPENERSFFAEFFGADNPASYVDITNRKAIRKVVQDGLKRLEEFKATVIQNYIASKGKIPSVPSGPTGVAERQPIKDLRQARRVATEMASKLPGGV